MRDFLLQELGRSLVADLNRIYPLLTPSVAKEFVRQSLLSPPLRSLCAGSGVGGLGSVVSAVSDALGDSLQRNPVSLTPWIPVPRLATLSSERGP